MTAIMHRRRTDSLHRIRVAPESHLCHALV
jgi:hypothetical protein